MSQYVNDDLKRNEITNFRELIFRYKRKDPILLRFSNVLYSNEGNEEMFANIEKEMGKATHIWAEPIPTEEESIDIMINLNKYGCNTYGKYKATHYIFALFPNWVLDNTLEKIRLIQNLAFYGEQDFLLSVCGDVNVTLVRRIYENIGIYKIEEI